jgi:hypothetical protein
MSLYSVGLPLVSGPRLLTPVLQGKQSQHRAAEVQHLPGETRVQVLTRHLPLLLYTPSRDKRARPGLQGHLRIKLLHFSEWPMSFYMQRGPLL